MPRTSAFQYPLLAVCFCLLLSGCENVFPDEYTTSRTYYFQKDRQIVVDSTQTLLHARVEPGTELVFTYQFKKDAPPNVSDGDFSETILFEIPTDGSSFELEGSELATIPVFYDRKCYCGLIESLKVTSGYIRGEQLSDRHWMVSASLQTFSVITEETFEVSFSDVFMLTQ